MNNKHNILIFAGTIEGRSLVNFLNQHKVPTFVCVATEYGSSLLPKGDYITSIAKRLNQQEMEQLIQQEHISFVVDATHPYAVLVSENIQNACRAGQVEYIRLVRNTSEQEDNNCIYVSNTKEAVEYLKETTGNVLLTTGSKELAAYTKLADYQSRLFPRILSTAEVVKECVGLGFLEKNLICMQGPFHMELNLAMIHQIDAAYLVTKESGRAGGFEEKIEAARQANIVSIIIGRPVIEEGYSLPEVKKVLIDRLELLVHQNLYIVGIGMGNSRNMTREAYEICEKADIVIGAKRVTDCVKELHKPVCNYYKPEAVVSYIKEHPEYETIVIMLSGDVGFYSGAKKLVTALEEYSPCVISGISSPAYFCTKINKSWDQMKLLSLHGRNSNILAAVKDHSLVFMLLGKKPKVSDVCNMLIQSGMEYVKIFIGEHLSYPDERIVSGSPGDFLDTEFSDLSVMVIENNKAGLMPITHGIRDEEFVRGKVPMTKSEVRSISLSKLGLRKNSIVYDIGSGTGSAAVEMAIQSSEGEVYAIEQKEDAVSLIEENKRRFGVSNLQVITGIAPLALLPLPVPTHVFIGGSSGNMESILENVFKKNQQVRIVINAITLETVGETVNYLKKAKVHDIDIVCVNIAKAKALGNYNMMMGQNPVYIISFIGGGKEDEIS